MRRPSMYSRYHGDDDEAELHDIVFQSRSEQVENERRKLVSQKTFIRQERRRLLLQKALLESDQNRFEASQDPDWFCQSSFAQPNERRIVIEVGGKIFEVTTQTARKDPRSLLAAFANDDSPLQSTDMGCFRVDRDWWIFRYILNFLRDGVLPRESKTLKALYQECSFWRLDSLKRAIEERHLHMVRRHHQPTPPPANGNNNSNDILIEEIRSGEEGSKEWWKKQPQWWGKKTPTLVSSASTSANMAQDQWWTGKTYRGRDFSKRIGKSKSRDSGERRDGTQSTWTVSERRTQDTTPDWYGESRRSYGPR